MKPWSYYQIGQTVHFLSRNIYPKEERYYRYDRTHWQFMRHIAQNKRIYFDTVYLRAKRRKTLL